MSRTEPRTPGIHCTAGGSDGALSCLPVSPVPEHEPPKLQSADRQEVGLGVKSRGDRSVCNPSRAGGNPAVCLTTRGPSVQMCDFHQKVEIPPRRGRETTSTPGSGQEPAPAFPARGMVWAGGEGPPRPAQQQGPKEARKVLWVGRAEACHLHLQSGSIFLWSCCWKLQRLAAAQAHLDKSLFPRRDGLEEGPLSLRENIFSSESGLYVLHANVGLVYTQKASFFQN